MSLVGTARGWLENQWGGPSFPVSGQCGGVKAMSHQQGTPALPHSTPRPGLMELRAEGGRGRAAWSSGTWSALGITKQPTHTHTHVCTHATHIHTRTHQAPGPTSNTAETQPGQGLADGKRLRAFPSLYGPSRQPSSAPQMQAGRLGPGPAIRYKIKNISNIQ